MSTTLVSSKSVETIVEEVIVDEVVIEEKFEKGLPLPVQSDVASDTSSTLVGSLRSPRRFLRRTQSHIMTDIDPTRSNFPFAWYCFMTGFTDAVIFSASFMWPAFHTGNIIQLAMAMGRLLHNPTFHIPDQQAVTSLITFLMGASLGRLGDRIGSATRAWMCLGTFLQSLCTMSAALCAWKSGQPVPENRTEPAWNNALTFAAIGFISASLGLQAIMAMRVKSQMGTTILVTVFWCDLAADPKLFKLKNPARDRKLFAMAALFLGGFVARVILQKTGAPSALGVGTGIRFLMAIGWLFAPASKASKP